MPTERNTERVARFFSIAYGKDCWGILLFPLWLCQRFKAGVYILAFNQVAPPLAADGFETASLD